MADQELILKISTDVKDANKGLEKVKKTTGETSTAAAAAAGNFRIMGVSLNGVKSAFAKIIPIAKGMFGTIKAGIASTGIGLIVLAIASLVGYFTNTKRGAEKLQVAFKAVGAAVAVITDRISAIGEAITKVFKGDFKGAAEDAKRAVSGLGAEIAKETRQMIELTRTLQKVKDAERDFSVERAETNRVIAEARLLAEDENATYEERLKALKTANDLEIKTTEKAIALQKEKLDAKRLEVEISESSAEDLDEIAQLEVQLIELQTSSFSKRKRLITSEETLRTEAAALQKSIDSERLKRLEELAKAEEDLAKKTAKTKEEILLLQEEDAEERALLKLEQDFAKAELDIENSVASDIAKNDALMAIATKFAIDKQNIEDKHATLRQQQADKELADAKKKAAEKIALEKLVSQSKADVAQQGLAIMGEIFGKESAAGKAAAVAQATINTYQAATNALATTPAPPPFPQIAAGITIASGLMQVQKILSVQPENKFASGGMVGGFGTGTSDSISARLSKGESVINARSTRMFKPLLSQINQAGGGVGFDEGGLDSGSGGNTMGVVKAYVVADDMTKTQDRLAKIRRKATI